MDKVTGPGFVGMCFQVWWACLLELHSGMRRVTGMVVMFDEIHGDGQSHRHYILLNSVMSSPVHIP